MASSGSDASRKRPRTDSGPEDESPTKRAASMEKGLLNDEGETKIADMNADAGIDAYMLDQEGPSNHQAPINGFDPLPQSGPPIMTRVQTVPTREKWDAIGQFYYLLGYSTICSLILIVRQAQVHVFEGG